MMTMSAHLAEKREATLSADGRYRYALSRRWGSGSQALWIGVNPSTADALNDDATIRKIRGFTKGIVDMKGFAVVNLYGWRATDVTQLRTVDDPVGPENDEWIERYMRDADLIVGAWGPLAKQPSAYRNKRAAAIKRIAAKVGKPIYAFGITKDGQPRHPLMTPYLEPMVKL